MDPTLLAGILGSLATVGAAFVPRIPFRKDKDPDLEEIEKITKKQYDILKPFVTDNCVKIIKSLEHGEMHLPEQLSEYIYPNLTLMGDERRKFDREFEYRLQYLQLLGLLTKPGSEYTITNFGVSFLTEARSRNHYIGIL